MSKMVQVFMVLRCFSCETFQVHQVKKSSNKWVCKICNEKQSVQKVYGQGTAADCRKHVQKLNMLRGEKEMAEQQMLDRPPEEKYADKECQHSCHNPEPVPVTEKDSRWKRYTEPQDSNCYEEEVEETGVYTTDKAEFQLTQKKKRRDLKSRLGSDPPKPHPLSKASRKRSLPDTSSVPHSQTSIHPDSAVAGKTGQLLSGSKSSIYTHSSSDRYTKLDDVTGFHSSPRQLPSSNPADKFSSFQTHVEKSGAYRNPTKEKKLEHLHMTKEDKMAMIRDDISRFSNSKQSASSSSSSIPAVSSRWSRFMTESEEGGEEGESVQTHMLQSRTGIARYN